MLQNHLHPTERSIYTFSVLCFIGFVSLLPWGVGSHARSVRGASANVTQQHLLGRTVTASVEEAQNLAAARLCRGVLSAARCETLAATPAAL